MRRPTKSAAAVAVAAVVAGGVLVTTLTAPRTASNPRTERQSQVLGGATNRPPAPGAGVACDGDGVRAGYDAEFSNTKSAFVVTHVVLSDIADTCSGATLQLHLSAGSEIHTVELRGVDAAEERLAIPAHPLAQEVTAIALESFGGRPPASGGAR